MVALWEQVPRIRAERQLDMAQAAAYPTMSPESRAAFTDRLLEVLAVGASVRERNLLSINSVPLSARAFRGNMRMLLGGGFSDR